MKAVLVTALSCAIWLLLEINCAIAEWPSAAKDTAKEEADNNGVSAAASILQTLLKARLPDYEPDATKLMMDDQGYSQEADNYRYEDPWQEDDDEEDETTEEDEYDYDMMGDEDESEPTSPLRVSHPRFNMNFGSSGGFIRSIIKFQLPESSWYKGPNICKRVTEDSEDVNMPAGGKVVAYGGGHTPSAATGDRSTSATCYESETSYRCTTETLYPGGKRHLSTVILECCTGYRKVQQSCLDVRNLADALTTAKKLGATTFAKAARNVFLPSQSAPAAENLTFFAPLDKHVIAKEGSKRQELNGSTAPDHVMAVGRAAELSVAAHVVAGYAFSGGFEDEKLIPTRWPGASIRTNIYDGLKKLITANCMPIKSMDNLATNGILHVVDGVLTPVTSSVWQHLQNDKKLSKFASMVQETFGEDKIGFDLPGQFTIFVPTNAAFEKPDIERRLKAGGACAARILRRHILPNVVCSQAIDGKVRMTSIDGDELILQKTMSGSITVANKASIVTADVMATNGVIHFVDEVLLMPEDMDFEETVAAEKLTEFQLLLHRTNMNSKLATNTTMFLPSNEAVMYASKGILEAAHDDPQELEKLVKYHIAPGILTCDKFSNQVGTSLGVPIRMQTYATFPFEHVVHTANCVRIVKKNLRTCRSIIHVVDEVLVPPSKNTLELLELHVNLTVFNRLLRKTSIQKELAQGTDPYTIYAPSDDALTGFVDSLDRLDNDTLDKFILRHVVSGYKCCAGVFPPPFYTRADTAAGGSVKLVRDGTSGAVTVSGGATVIECDAVGTNGVIHVIDKVIPPGRQSTHPFGRTSFPDIGVF